MTAYSYSSGAWRRSIFRMEQLLRATILTIIVLTKSRVDAEDVLRVGGNREMCFGRSRVQWVAVKGKNRNLHHTQTSPIKLMFYTPQMKLIIGTCHQWGNF